MKITQVDPDIGRLERKYVKKVLKKKWLTEGDYAKYFINHIKSFTGAKYAVLAPNGTLAIYMALSALGIKKGDKVVVPDLTFNASASPLHFLGAIPVFCDVDPYTFQMDVGLFEEIVEKQDVKAVIPVHLFGQAVDMEPLMEIAEEKGILVMEDAAQGLGVTYDFAKYEKRIFGLKHVGTIGDAGIFAFYADKNVTCGEGGVVVTNREDVHKKLLYLRNQGRLSSGLFVHDELGMNFRVTDLQCAIGCAQMERIDSLLEKKMDTYKTYQYYLHDKLVSGSIKLMKISEYSTHVPLRFPILVQNKEKVMHHLETHDVPVRDMSLPLHRNPCWSHRKYKEDDFPNANMIYEQGMLLPFHNHLPEWKIWYICSLIREGLNL